MRNLKLLCAVIGVSQLVLGLLFLLLPLEFARWMGLSPPPADNGYLYAMLAARFLVYGVGMFIILRDPLRYRFWLDGMLMIQAIDLAGGVFYVLSGRVALASAAFPMINATLFMLLLALWRPRAEARRVDA